MPERISGVFHSIITVVGDKKKQVCQCEPCRRKKVLVEEQNPHGALKQLLRYLLDKALPSTRMMACVMVYVHVWRFEFVYVLIVWVIIWNRT